jgi:hypothetical protein
MEYDETFIERNVHLKGHSTVGYFRVV